MHLAMIQGAYSLITVMYRLLAYILKDKWPVEAFVPLILHFKANRAIFLFTPLIKSNPEVIKHMLIPDLPKSEFTFCNRKQL